MKKNILILPLIIALHVFFDLTAQEAVSKQDNQFETVKIKTSAVCDMCKERLEKNLSFEKGVRSVSLDDETKEITITFRKGRNSKDNLRKAITRIGYDADELQADQKAHDRLPACCQKGSVPH